MLGNLDLDVFADLQRAVRHQPAAFAADIDHDNIAELPSLSVSFAIESGINARRALDMSWFAHEFPV
jgi:hypothetical protein